MTTQEQNIAAVRGAYDAANQGDASKLIDLWHEDVTICTWTLHGGKQRILTKSEALGAFGVVAKLDGVQSTIIEANAIGDDIVSTVVRCYRRFGDIETTPTSV
ncbi:MAG: nuclear transport factor 2 family protein [Acidimicrobiia bacterium]